MWRIVFHDAFYEELMELAEEVQDGLASCKGLLETYGHNLAGRMRIHWKDPRIRT